MDRAPSPFALALALAMGCGVQEEATPRQREVPFACSRDADCPEGSCLEEVGFCAHPTGRLTTLLFEVTPQPADPVYGGARYLTFQDVSAAPVDGARLDLNVPPRVPVTGRVLAAPEQSACLQPARSTLPATLTFKPREQLLGLNLPSYELSTVFDASPGVREWVFLGSLPPGRYDVYMRPDVDAIAEDCRVIPQRFKNRSVGLVDGGDNRLELQQPPPSALRLSITWSDDLEGWRLDMVHPETGEVLSNRVTLRASDVDTESNVLVTTLNYSRADEDYIEPGSEFVRLTPPNGVAAGTVLMQRYGIELVMSGEAAIGNVSEFGVPVEFQAWVWKEGETDAPVPGEVSFTALELDEGEAVITSFEASAMVDATGQINVSLLPGRYRVRVTPPGLAVPNLGMMASYESTVRVWPNGDPALDRQGGHVIGVPAARSLSGRVVAAANGMPLSGVEVRASAPNRYRDLCSADETAEPRCERPGPPVLQRARGEDPFVPRMRSGLAGPSGFYRIDGLDCGRCDPESPALFDVTVRPDVSTGLPWVVRPGIDLYRDADELLQTPLRIPVPVVRPMRVTYGSEPRSEPEPDTPAVTPTAQRLSGALVRAYVVLDSRGELVEDPESLPACATVAELDTTPCVQSLLQVAEARTGSDGEFLLLLPPDLQ